MGTKYYEAILIKYRKKNWARFIDNPKCVRKALNHEYWASIKKLSIC